MVASITNGDRDFVHKIFVMKEHGVKYLQSATTAARNTAMARPPSLQSPSKLPGGTTIIFSDPARDCFHHVTWDSSRGPGALPTCDWYVVRQADAQRANLQPGLPRCAPRVQRLPRPQSIIPSITKAAPIAICPDDTLTAFWRRQRKGQSAPRDCRLGGLLLAVTSRRHSLPPPPLGPPLIATSLAPWTRRH